MMFFSVSSLSVPDSRQRQNGYSAPVFCCHFGVRRAPARELPPAFCRRRANAQVAAAAAAAATTTAGLFVARQLK